MNQGELLLLLVLLLLPDVEACDGGVICDKNGCSLTNKDECPQSCTNAEYSFSDSDRTGTHHPWRSCAAAYLVPRPRRALRYLRSAERGPRGL